MELTEVQECFDETPDCPGGRGAARGAARGAGAGYGGNYHSGRGGGRAKRLPPECDVNAWSEWSPCSKKCGEGTKVRKVTGATAQPISLA